MHRRLPTDHEETEWQFDVAAEVEPVEGWLLRRSGPGLVVAPGPTAEISDAYYDSEDWRLRRAGYALRVRKTGDEVECTIKSLAPAGDGPSRRREISEPLIDAGPATPRGAPGPVGEISRALLGDRELRRMFESRTRRQRFPLLLEPTDPDGTGGSTGGGVRIGEVSLDTSEIPLDGGPVSLRRVEVEAAAGTPPSPDLWGFVDEMRFDLGLDPAAISKYEAGLQAAGLSPDGPADLAPEAQGPKTAVG